MKLKDPKSIKVLIMIVVLAITAFFVFYRLGYYALWDDEADTALFAQSVWQTGDTYAMLDHNLIAHTYGQELKGMYNRFIPPLGFYLAAPFIGLSPQQGSAFAARLPFAICGLLTVALLLFWLWKAKASLATWVLMAIGILGNVSLMLYARQCRYFAPAILAVTALVFMYIYRNNTLRNALSIAGVSILLLASNYLFYLAVYIGLCVDYLVWGRHQRSFQMPSLLGIFLPQIVIGGLLVSLYNPFGTDLSQLWGISTVSWLEGKVTLLWWNIRDLNSCEYGVGVLILLAPLFYRMTKDLYLLRGFTAIAVYLFAISLFSPQQIGWGLLPVATIRYLAPLIPLCIFMSVRGIQVLSMRVKWLAIPLALLAFGTNVLHGGPLVGFDEKTHFSAVIAQGRFRSTIFDFVQELMKPHKSAYRTVANWMNRHIEDGASVAVFPNYATYPLMYHAPRILYAWQLKEKTVPYKNLPAIHFFGEEPPDYFVVFGPYILQAQGVFTDLETRNIHYKMIEHIDVYWYDLIRPELFWHAFKEVSNYDPQSQAVYIFKKEQQ